MEIDGLVFLTLGMEEAMRLELTCTTTYYWGVRLGLGANNNSPSQESVIHSLLIKSFNQATAFFSLSKSLFGKGTGYNFIEKFPNILPINELVKIAKPPTRS